MNAGRVIVLLLLAAAAAAGLALNEHERVGSADAPASDAPASDGAEGPAADPVSITLVPLHDAAVEMPLRASASGGTATRRAAASAAAPAENGLPTLALDYVEIGLPRYLELVEKSGGLFLVRRDGSLGPRLIWRRGWQVVLAFDDADLAIERPFLIRDAGLADLLPVAGTTQHDRRDQVVLVLDRTADRKLWEGVRAALAGAGLEPGDVASVQGRYRLQAANALEVQLERAWTRTPAASHPLDLRTALR